MSESFLALTVDIPGEIDVRRAHSGDVLIDLGIAGRQLSLSLARARRLYADLGPVLADASDDIEEVAL